MMAKTVYKIPRGKLLKIDLNYDENNNLIKNIRITGDFFAHPEESMEILEKKLKNTVLDKHVLLKKTHEILDENHVQLVGLNAEEIVKAILMCKK